MAHEVGRRISGSLRSGFRRTRTGRGGLPAISMTSFITYTQRVWQETWDYTLKQAVAVWSVSFGTIKRRLRAGHPPHARCLNDATSAWVVSLGDPAAAGLTISLSRSLRARPSAAVVHGSAWTQLLQRHG